MLAREEAGMIKQHGLLFAYHLMPPLLDGTKTQTRRPVKPQPLCGQTDNPLDHVEYARDGMPIWWSSTPPLGVKESNYYDNGMPCPYGRVGDLIWARETFTADFLGSRNRYVYRADNDALSRCRWTPSIHMPKRVCRCWLEITDVRVQRIQEISEEDAKAEGILDGGCLNCGQSSLTKPQCCDSPSPSFRDSFCYEWKQIYPGSWERNDWVWCLSFKRVEAPE